VFLWYSLVFFLCWKFCWCLFLCCVMFFKYSSRRCKWCCWGDVWCERAGIISIGGPNRFSGIKTVKVPTTLSILMGFFHRGRNIFQLNSQVYCNFVFCKSFFFILDCFYQCLVSIARPALMGFFTMAYFMWVKTAFEFDVLFGLVILWTSYLLYSCVTTIALQKHITAMLLWYIDNFICVF